MAAVALIWISYDAGNLLGGWSGGTFADGGIRMSYSFLAGLLVFRSGWILKNKLGFIALSFLLTLAFISSGLANSWLIELIIVVFFFPFLVALGAGSELSAPLRKVCTFMGNISYPLYMTHYFGIWWFGNYYVTQNPSQGELVWVIVIGTIVMVIFAWLVMTFYDVPLRNYLNRIRNEKLRLKRVER